MLDAAETLGCLLQPQPGEVEEAEQRVVAEVEEEVRRARVVAVLDQLDEREAQQPLVERDRLLDVAADQRGVVDPAAGRRRSVGRRYQVFATQLLRVVRSRRACSLASG